MRRAIAAGLAASLCACALRGGGQPAPAAPARAEPELLLRGATVMTAAGPTLERADVWLRGASIVSVGPALQVPPGLPTVDVSGRWITPGLIDPHSHMGVYPVPGVAAHSDGNESSGPLKPEVRAIESFWPQDPAIRRAVAGGVTTIHALPGSANLVGGQGVTLSLVPARSAEAMRFPGAPTTMKMACGENPKRVYGERRQAPVTRMGEVAMLRGALEEARAWEPDPKKPLDHGKQALKRAIAGEILIQNHCYRADEMLLRIALFDEFGTRPRAFHHAVEAYKIRARLAETQVGAVVWADWWGAKLEVLDAVPAAAALLHEAGVRVSLHSDSPLDVQRLNQQAAAALAAGRRAGLSQDGDDAIRWITANPAWVLGIEEQVGTLEPGKRADLVVWSADPLSVYARALRVYNGGMLVHEREGDRRFPRSDFELGTGAGF
jgi:imidazolonepropionase-like amidohydrolase